MLILDNIELLVNKSKMTPCAALTQCGLRNNALTEWRKGKGKPSVDALLKIADYFNVSLDWLTGRTESETGYAGELFDETDKDDAKIKKFLTYLNHDDKIEIMGYMRGILRRKGLDVENIA
jgi:transcriptional regulator with XRE-family HTH domain